MLPISAARWQEIESAYHHLVAGYGYQEIRTPVFEDVALFKRTAGETSDIVSKEMYEFRDKGDREIALKPEGTAPAMRAVIEHNLAPTGTHLRLWYATACYRYGRPAKGRLRELHQLGAEFVGSSSAEADAEIIELAHRYFDSLGMSVRLMVNSIGRADCRAKYREVILEHVSGYLKDADEATRDRIEKNPLGMLDSRDAAQQEALEGVPPILDYLEDASRERFDSLQSLLTEAGVPYEVSPSTVRGLDYYTETVFEGVSDLLPGLSVIGGGRYDNLIKQLGGPETPCVGFGIGMERVLAVLEAQGRIAAAKGPDAFLIRASAAAGSQLREVARECRSRGIRIGYDVDGRSMKSQLRQADSSGASFAVFFGEDELASGNATVKNLTTGEQTPVEFGKVADFLCAHRA